MTKSSGEPFFSVIIPYYNREKYILRAINSVIHQSYSDFELILVDDGSSDSSFAKVESLISQMDSSVREKVFHLSTDRNHGVSFARNLAVRNSCGKYLSFLDSDDEFLPNKLKLQADYIQDNPHFKIVHGNEEWIRNGTPLNQLKKHAKGGGDQFIPSLKLCCISPSCVVIERDLFWICGGFREDYPVCEDYDLWLKITSSNKVGFIQDPLIIKYGGHEDQLSHKFFAMDYYRVKSLNYIKSKIDNQGDSLKYSALETELLKKLSRLYKGAKKHKNNNLLKELSRPPFSEYLNLVRG